jgi:hypothetical protein
LPRPVLLIRSRVNPTMRRPGCRETSGGSRQPLVVCDAMCCARLGNRDSMDPWIQRRRSARTGAASEGPSLQVLGQWLAGGDPSMAIKLIRPQPTGTISMTCLALRNVQGTCPLAGRPAHMAGSCGSRGSLAPGDWHEIQEREFRCATVENGGSSFFRTG